MPTGLKIDATAEQLAGVKYDVNGLVPAIAQDVVTKDVLMVAWMNAETLRMTLDEGRMVYWSRSRQEVWRKGDTSGDGQYVVKVCWNESRVAVSGTTAAAAGYSGGGNNLLCTWTAI